MAPVQNPDHAATLALIMLLRSRPKRTFVVPLSKLEEIADKYALKAQGVIRQDGTKVVEFTIATAAELAAYQAEQKKLALRAKLLGEVQ
ncbi:MAG: hypothetical protein HY673_14210 [Chloroflexi bacterium]|nr:hypothetical protein [Chloroflexota bacterium]